MQQSSAVSHTMRDLQRSLDLDVLAECLYETAHARDAQIVPEWHRLSRTVQYPYRLEAAAAVARLDPDTKQIARLRAREQMALNGYGRDYSRCDPQTQNRIAYLVLDATNTYDRVLEGIFSPLAPSRRAELEPERRAS